MIREQWRRFVNRCVWSWAGWRHAWASEPSLRFWTVIVVLSSGLALALPLTSGERVVILPLGVLLLAAEMMNTGIERAVDRISTEDHELSRQAKDASSAAVALTAIAGAVAWAVVLWRIAVG